MSALKHAHFRQVLLFFRRAWKETTLIYFRCETMWQIISGPATRFLKFLFWSVRYLEKQILTLFHLWSLKFYTKSCFHKLTARSGWLKLIAVGSPPWFDCQGQFRISPFLECFKWPLWDFLKVIHWLRVMRTYTIFFVRWTKLHHELSNYLR